MQVMDEREEERVLSERIEVDDAYLGGVHTGYSFHSKQIREVGADNEEVVSLSMALAVRGSSSPRRSPIARINAPLPLSMMTGIGKQSSED